MLTDYNTKKKRLTKKDPSADFRLADSDDFFGFNETPKNDYLKYIAVAVIALPVLWLIVYTLLTMTPNI